MNLKKFLGFGMTSDDASSGTSVYLRYVNMTVINTNACNIFYPGFINDYKVCTETSGGRSTCAGDNGGPLVVEPEPGRKIIIGVGSFRSSRGCQAGDPGEKFNSRILSVLIS
jgi:trypsin